MIGRKQFLAAAQLLMSKKKSLSCDWSQSVHAEPEPTLSNPKFSGYGPLKTNVNNRPCALMFSKVRRFLEILDAVGDGRSHSVDGK